MNELGKLLTAVDLDLVLLVEQYALETGEEPAQCINEALSDWLEVAAGPRLEQLRNMNKPSTIAQMAVAAM